jgi:hypothetical protein
MFIYFTVTLLVMTFTAVKVIQCVTHNGFFYLDYVIMLSLYSHKMALKIV